MQWHSEIRILTDFQFKMASFSKLVPDLLVYLWSQFLPQVYQLLEHSWFGMWWILPVAVFRCSYPIRSLQWVWDNVTIGIIATVSENNNNKNTKGSDISQSLNKYARPWCLLEYVQFGHATGQHWSLWLILIYCDFLTSQGYYHNPGRKPDKKTYWQAKYTPHQWE